MVYHILLVKQQFHKKHVNQPLKENCLPFNICEDMDHFTQEDNIITLSVW